MALPQRAPGLSLPPLRQLLHDDPMFAFRASDRELAPQGMARLRVWQAGEDGGYLAAVTESGAGFSSHAAAAEIWRSVSAVWQPLSLLLHSPAALDPSGRDSAELLVAAGPGKTRTIAVFPPHPAHEDMCRAWWERFGGVIITV